MINILDVQKTNNTFVYYNGEGRFGNHLFGFFSTLGIGASNNRQAVFGEHLLDIRTLFPKINMVTVQGTFWKNWAIVKENKSQDYDVTLLSLPKKNITLSSSYLQSYHYFKNLTALIYGNISFINPKIALNVNKMFHFIKEKNKNHSLVTVGIHVRRGDLLKKRAQKTGYLTVPLHVLLFAMKYMESKFNNATFIVTSDDKKWCYSNLKQKNVIISNFSSALDDFATLIHCSHIIMTVGTFGWWASWFVAQKGGTVMYYRHHYVLGSTKERNFVLNNYFPKNWLSYDNQTVIETRLIKSR